MFFWIFIVFFLIYVYLILFYEILMYVYSNVDVSKYYILLLCLLYLQVRDCPGRMGRLFFIILESCDSDDILVVEASITNELFCNKVVVHFLSKNLCI